MDKLLKSTYTARDMGTLGFEDSDAKLVLLKRVFKLGQITFEDNTPTLNAGLRHAPLVSTNRDQRKDQVREFTAKNLRQGCWTGEKSWIRSSTL